jgi:trehalose 2-sulfotransferase
MLHDIETGYEGKFDFPARSEPPATVYMLASIPRSGSSFLSHLLWQSGCLGAPLEYLNFDPAGPYFFAASSPDQQMGLWRSVLRRRTSPNGVFGFKCFPIQLQALEETNPALLKAVMSTVFSGRPRILYLTRRNRVAQMVSYARARLSGIWRAEQEKGGREPVAYSEAVIETAGKWIDSQAAAWEEMFRDLGIEPLRLYHEDVVARPGDTVKAVGAWLGIAIDPAAAVPIPTVEKQDEAEAREWVARYSEAKGL